MSSVVIITTRQPISATLGRGVKGRGGVGEQRRYPFLPHRVVPSDSILFLGMADQRYNEVRIHNIQRAYLML